MTNTDYIFEDLNSTLPKKILSAIVSDTQELLPLEEKAREESDGCISQTFSYKYRTKKHEFNIAGTLNWETRSKYTPKGLFIELKGICTDGKEFASFEETYDLYEYRCKHSLSDLITMIEKLNLGSWLYDTVTDFAETLKNRFDESLELTA